MSQRNTMHQQSPRSNESHARQRPLRCAKRHTQSGTGLVVALALLAAACGSNDSALTDSHDPMGSTTTTEGTGSRVMEDVTPPPRLADAAFLQAATTSTRVGLPLTASGAILNATALAAQLQDYDPGSLLRCDLGGQAAYDTAIDAIGGVSWGYQVSRLEDQSQPRIYAGFQRIVQEELYPSAATGDANAGATAVEIVKPDIVAVTESAALFHSPSHGLLMVRLENGEPRFECGAQLPGRPDQFFFHEGHLVVMTRAQQGGHSHLLHFELEGATLSFRESLDLGAVSILDSRRFNDKLVFYTDLRLEAPEPAPTSNSYGLPQGGAAYQEDVYVPVPQPEHRALRVFRLGDTLTEEMHDTLVDTTLAEDQLVNERVTPETEEGSLIYESRRFGRSLWASQRYFVVTEEVDQTFLDGWQERTHSRCTASHVEETEYEYCWTEYETRPNPDFVEPDNSGGDRSCQGATLSDCLKQVARVSNPTIQVPVGRSCEDRTRSRWVCDTREQVTTQYPVFRRDQQTQLFIYEYGDSGFVRLDNQVHEITTEGLEQESPDAAVTTLSTSAESFDLAVPGQLQTLYFQNDYLYAISQGILQVYAMGGPSIVRSSTLQVVNESLQSTLFSGDSLYLSDFGWRGGDHSTLRVVNLQNPGFPTLDASSHELPGGHRSILPSQHGIFTIGSVRQLEGQAIHAIKLGLFSAPFAEESAYLILATDMSQGATLGAEDTQWFNGGAERLLLPYSGRVDGYQNEYRVGVSRIEPDEIVSEGAMVLPEPAQRVRPLPLEGESYLSFANNSIHWLTPESNEWQASPVLEYFTPIQVYRLNESDDYAEVQRLGNRCRLYFANAAVINQREAGSYSQEFTCNGYYATAYANRLLFGADGIEFDAEGASIRVLEPEEVAETQNAISQRPICVLSLELVSNVYVNPSNIPEDAEATCMSPTEYQEQQNLLNEGVN